MKNKIPPPLVMLIFAGLIWLVASYLPLGTIEFQGQALIGKLIALLAVSISLIAFFSFKRAKTTVNPLNPEQATALVTTGIFGVSRNPMYLSMALLLVAEVVYLGTLACLILVAGYMIYINELQIKPEEDALTKLFGAEFEAYRTKVRRWI